MLARDATAAETLEMSQEHKIFIKYPKNEWVRGKTCKKPSWMMHFPQQRGLDEMNIAKTSKIICILLPTTFLLISHLLPLTGSCSLGRDLVSKAGNSERSWNENSKKKSKSGRNVGGQGWSQLNVLQTSFFLRVCHTHNSDDKEKRRKKAHNAKQTPKNKEGKRKAKRFPGKSAPSPVPTGMEMGRMANGGGESHRCNYFGERSVA